MGLNTKISWAHHTWNPWRGCDKVSPGCKYCYMFRDQIKYGNDPMEVVRTSDASFNKPLQWANLLYENPEKAAEKGIFFGMRVFVCSWSDFFHEKADGWRADAFEIMRQTPEFIYMIPTKRAERFNNDPFAFGPNYKPLPNLWLGVSVENRKTWFDRIPLLLMAPAVLRWVSMEPLLEDIWEDMDDVDYEGQCYDPMRGIGDISPSLHGEKIDWVVVGGESGNDTGDYRYRHCELEWIEGVVKECKEANVPVHVKQLGTQLAKNLGVSRHGKKIEEWPVSIRYQEYPDFKLNPMNVNLDMPWQDADLLLRWLAIILRQTDKGLEQNLYEQTENVFFNATVQAYPQFPPTFKTLFRQQALKNGWDPEEYINQKKSD